MGDADNAEDEDFAEQLPGPKGECPPKGASAAALEAVYRLVPVAHLTDAHFASFAALGDERPETMNVTDCEWASCSLRTSLDALLKMKGLRRRNPYIATLSIPANSGRHTTGGTHVNFWRFAGFSIVSAVVSNKLHGLP
jgi:hypothetical protein